MSPRKRTGVDWLYDGFRKVIHALPSNRMYSERPGIALCGYGSGAWNGGDHVFKNGKPGEGFTFCKHCKRLARGYAERVEKERQQKWERWATTKLRARLIDKARGLIEKMDKGTLLIAVMALRAVRSYKESD